MIREKIIEIVFIIVVAFTLGYFITVLSNLSNDHDNLKNKVSNIETELAATKTSLLATENDNANLFEALDTEQRRNNDLADQIDDIAGTVGTLDKLSKTDPEFLQKYSKVYFLNEHYVPKKLASIPDEYLAPDKEDLSMEYRVNRYLKNLLSDAEDDGIDLRIISAFRSFSEQSSLKSAYSVTYGSRANTFSADQGFSEHQLGTTVDFSTKELGLNFTSIASTEAYKWLNKNAYKYGFVLSYPENNDYYVFEPWHWRFVGKDLARYLDRENLSFYDLSQRKIDEYLINFFD